MPDHKGVVVYEEHWAADHRKVIYYGKERPRDSFLTKRFFLCKDCQVTNIVTVLSVDEV